MGQPDEIILHIISANLQSAREYRMMAKEFMKKADDLEGEMLKIAIHINEQKAKTCEDEAAKPSEKSAKDVFENFGDMFGGKKKGATK